MAKWKIERHENDKIKLITPEGIDISEDLISFNIDFIIDWAKLETDIRARVELKDNILNLTKKNMEFIYNLEGIEAEKFCKYLEFPNPPAGTSQWDQ